jgi:protein-tyrosine-phosphatase
MAQAFAIMFGGNKVEAYSAGSKPSGIINPKAIEVMKELGYDLSRHQSKALNEIDSGPYDYVVTMGCGDACPWVPAQYRLEWDIPDPRDLNLDAFRKIRDLIAEKVKKEIIEKI